VENIILSTTLKAEMAMTSSKVAAAMTNVGIPLDFPYPLSCRLKRHGITTAGDTAAITALKVG
jgi:hypothetical protein